MLEKTLESPLDCKEIKAVNPKGNQLWVFIGKTDVEAEAPVLWPPAAKSWLIGKDPDAGKDWRQEEKGMTEDEMVGLHHWLNGHELSKLPETVKDREAWHAAVHGVAELDMTEGLNWTESVNLITQWTNPSSYVYEWRLEVHSQRLGCSGYNEWVTNYPNISGLKPWSFTISYGLCGPGV